MGYDVVVPILTLIIGFLVGNEVRALFEHRKKDG
jgi:hypothetical protein